MVDVNLRRTRFAKRRLQPGIYFWRVRALGRQGKGSFTPVQILDALSRANSRRPARRQPRRGAQVVVPLAVAWTQPADHALFTDKAITVQGTVEKEARVTVGPSPPITVEGHFEVPYRLNRGLNEVTLIAVRDNRMQRLTRSLLLVEPATLEPILDKVQDLRLQLVQTSERHGALADLISELIHRSEAADDQEVAHQLDLQARSVELLHKQERRRLERDREELSRLLKL